MHIPKKTKILYLITQSEMGGAQRYIFNLATNLKDKFEIVVGAGEHGELLNKLEKQNIKTINLNFARSINNPFKIFFEFITLFKIIKKHKPDIVHLNSSKIGVVGSIAAKLAGVKKVIYTVHGFIFNEPMSKPARLFYIWAERFSALFKDKLICVSEFDRQQGLKYKIAKEKKFITINNGIDSDIQFLEKDLAKSQLNIKSSFVVGTLANFYPTKDLITLIEAGKKVIEKLPAAKIFIIGEGKQRKLLEQKISSLKLNDKVILAGQKKDAYKYLPAFDIYVCSSVKEGFPFSILEAMAALLPIISTNVGGIGEMIKDNYNGILIEPRRPNVLANKILSLINNSQQRKYFGVNSKKIILQRFSLKTMIAKTTSQYV